MTGELLLKWGTVKGWSNLSDDALAALQRFSDLGMTASAMQQHMTPEHKAALCNLIDLVDEPITNDWSGEDMTREEAKVYVMSYRRKE